MRRRPPFARHLSAEPLPWTLSVTTGDWGPPGCVIDSSISVNVTESGDIWAYGGGISVNSSPAEQAGTGQIDNLGRIGSSNSHGISIENAADYDSITNQAGARIEARYYGIDLSYAGTLQTIDNHADIISYQGQGIRTVHNGTIVQLTNHAGATISGHEDGILVWGGQIDQIDNSGLITGGHGIRDNYNGLWGWTGQIGQINNSQTGIIRGNSYAIQLTRDLTGTINNAGWLDGRVELHGSTLNLIGDQARVSGAITGNANSRVNVLGNFVGESSITAGSLHIDQGARLQGSHSIVILDHSAALYNSGTLLGLPGTTTYINGRYVQQADGLFVSQLQLGPQLGLQYGRLFSTTSIDLGPQNQFAVDVLGSPQLTAGDQLQNVLWSYGGLVNEELPTVQDNSALFDFLPVVTTTDYDTRLSLIIAAANDVSAVDAVLEYGNRSALGLAGLIDELVETGAMAPEQLAGLITALGQLESEAALAAALDQLLPNLNGNLRQASLQALLQGRFGINQRLSQLRGMSAGDATLQDRHVWIMPLGSRIDQNSRNGFAGYDADTNGLSLGADALLRDDLRVGLSFSYLDSRFDNLSAARQRVEGESYLLGAYASQMLDGQTQLNLQGSIGANRLHSQRSISLPGITQQAKASYTQWTSHLGAELQRSYSLSNTTRLDPLLSLDYSRISDSGYRESGAGALNLRVSGDNTDELLLGLAGRLQQDLNPRWQLQAQLGSYYDLLNDDQQVTASLVGGGGQFVTRGIDSSRWRTRAGLGVQGETAGGLQMTASYDHEWRSGYRQRSLSLLLRKPFESAASGRNSTASRQSSGQCSAQQQAWSKPSSTCSRSPSCLAVSAC